jgi:hypothetical protein
MKKLYLDDIRTPQTEGWIIVRNYEDFVAWIRLNGCPDEVSFDHDLGEDVAKEKVEAGMSKRKAREQKKETKSGYDAAKWLGQHCLLTNTPYPKWNCHSANPVGKANIEAYISSVIKHQNQL